MNQFPHKTAGVSQADLYNIVTISMTVENYKIIDKKWVTHKMRNLQYIYNQFMQSVTAELKVVWWQGLPSISYSGKLRNVLIENTWYKQKMEA